MFCKNCGTKLPDDAKFCNSCGTATGVNAQAPKIEEPKAEVPKADVPKTDAPKATVGTQTPATPAPKKKYNNVMKTIGIILAALGVFSVIGAIINDDYWNMQHNGFSNDDYAFIGAQAVMIIVGAFLIYRSYKIDQ